MLVVMEGSPFLYIHQGHLVVEGVVQGEVKVAETTLVRLLVIFVLLSATEW